MPSQRPPRTDPQTVVGRTHLRAAGPLPKYLFRRGSTLYFKRKIPADVAHGFPEYKGQVWKSLGTSLLEKARVGLAVEVAEFDLKVAALRCDLALRRAAVRSDPQGVAPIAPLGADAAAGAGVGEPLFLPGSLPPTVSIGASAQAPDEVRATRSDEVARSPGEPRRVGRPQRQAVTSPKSNAGLEPARSVGKAARSASPPSIPAVKPTANVRPHRAPAAGMRPVTMLHLFEDWKLKQSRPRTVTAVHTAVMEFRTLHGPLAVVDINKAHARAYRDVLIERSLSKGTVENRLGFLATLIRHGMQEMVEELAINPFERIVVTGAKGLRAPKDRRAYDVHELNLLYTSRLYTGGYRPDGQCVDAAYWAPLLGPFLGARIEEVCQLRVEDIHCINGAWCVRICDLGEDQNVKTDSSFRRVPLHETLIKTGFLVYAARMAQAGQERLFPTLTNDNANGIYSNAVGKWFGRYLGSIGLGDHRLDYHSFRYTFRQRCSLCGIENEVRDALTGHWLSNTDSGRTYMKAENGQYPFPKLVAAMKMLAYDELRISHLIVADPMEGVEVHLLT